MRSTLASFTSIISPLLLIAAAACAVEEPARAASPAPLITIAKQSTNSLQENAIAQYAAELNQLVNQPYVNDPLTRQLAAVESGASLLEYAARCMFGEDTTVLIPRLQRAPLVVPALRPLGLAPAWIVRGLTAEEQRYLMGCLLAHINVIPENAVSISVRGLSPALAPTFDERRDFPLLEGAFYGEFGDPADPEQAALTRGYACWGPAYFTCGGQAATVFHQRLCTMPGACPHLTVTGPCEAQVPNATACRPRMDDIYDECYPVATSGPPPSQQYRAGVITTYLSDPPCH